jgi:hypothetical protein
MLRSACVLATLGLAAAASGAAGQPRVRLCPTNVLATASGTAPVARVLRAAERRLAQQTIDSQGQIYHLTPRNAPIDVIVRLATGDSALFERVRHAAASACGGRTATASWAIHYSVPVGLVADTGVYRFFVETRAGWRFWGHWCGAGRSAHWRHAYCR